MATVYFKGDALPRAQVTHVTPANPEAGDVFTLTINRKSISVTAGASPTLESVIEQLVEAIGQFDNDIPEWGEVSASVGTDAAGNATHLILTGDSDGTSFTVTSGTTNLSAITIIVTTVQAGSAAQNMKQRLTLPGPPASGNFTMTFAGQTTASTALGASAATVTTRLEALSSIGSGNVSVVKNGVGDFTIEFIGTLAAARQPLIVGNNVDLAGASTVVVSTIRQGRPASYAKGPVYTLTITPPVQSFRFKFVGGATYPNITDQYLSDFVANGSGCTADDIRTALKSIMVPAILADPSDADDNDNEPGVSPAYTLVDVIGDAGGPFTITLRDGLQVAMSATDHLEIDTDAVYTSAGVIEPDSEAVQLDLQSAASTTGISEQQAIYLTSGPTGGTFDLTFQGQTASGVAYNANAAAITAALVALSNIGAADVTTTGSGTRYDPWVVTFASGLASTAVQQMSGDGTNLTGATIEVEVVQDAKPGINEQQEIAFTGGTPTGGTFTLTFNAETTGSLDFDATAAEVETALEGLTTPIVGDFNVTGGPLPGVPIVVEFKQTYAASNVAAITGTSSLTASNTQTLVVSSNTVEPTGPQYWDEPLNWSGGAIPTTGDKAWVDKIATDITEGLDGITDVLAELHFTASFTGKFGRLPVNPLGYYEYRQLSGDTKATLILVGEGVGGGSPYINMNSLTTQTQLIAYKTGAPDDSSIPALNWKGTHASNVVRIFKGNFGSALLVGEVATIATLQIGYLTDRDGDVEYSIGPGITVTTIQVSGGDGQIDLGTANATTLTLTGGNLVLNGSFGVSTTFAVAPDTDDVNATVVWNTTGTLGGAPVVSGAGKLDFSQDMRTKTVTNPIEVQGAGAIVDDPFQVVSNLRLDLNYCAGKLNDMRLGNNVRITRGTPS